MLCVCAWFVCVCLFVSLSILSLYQFIIIKPFVLSKLILAFERIFPEYFLTQKLETHFLSHFHLADKNVAFVTIFF